MQDTWPCLPAVRDGIIKALSPARIGRYLPAAGGTDLDLALRLYVWNGRLHEAFVLPCQFAEIAIRNAVAAAVAYRFRTAAVPWHLPDSPFEHVLSHEGRRLLAAARDIATTEHGGNATVDHCIANLNFGFWTALTGRRYAKQFWAKGIHWSFRHAPAGTTVEELHRRLTAIRDWRNRMAHHYALFDKGPAAQYGNILTVIGWVSPDLRWLTTEVSRVGTVIKGRPSAPPPSPQA